MRLVPPSPTRRPLVWLLLLLLVAGGAGIHWVEQHYLPQLIDRFHATTGWRVEVVGLGPSWHRGPQLRARGVTFRHSDYPEPFEIAAVGWSWRISELLSGRFGGHIELEHADLGTELPPRMVRLGFPADARLSLIQTTLTPVTEAEQTRFTGHLTGTLNHNPFTAEFDFGTLETLERGAVGDVRLAAQFTDRPLHIELEGRVDDLPDWSGVALTARVRDLIPSDWAPVRRAGLARGLADARMTLDARLEQPGDWTTARLQDLHAVARGGGIYLSARGMSVAAGFDLDLMLDGRWTAAQAAERGLPGLPTEFAARASLSGDGEHWVLDVMHGGFDWPQLGLSLDGRGEWRDGEWRTPLVLGLRHLDLPALGEAFGFDLPQADDWRASAVWRPGSRRLDEVVVELSNPDDALRVSGELEWPETGRAMSLRIEFDTRKPGWLMTLIPSLSGPDSIGPLERVSLSTELEHGSAGTGLRALHLRADSRALNLTARGSARMDWPNRNLHDLALDLSGTLKQPDELLADKLPTAIFGALPSLDYRARLDWAAGGTIDLQAVEVTGGDSRGSLEWRGMLGDLGGQPHWRGRLGVRITDPGTLRPWLPEGLAETGWEALLPLGFSADLDSVEHPLGLAGIELASEAFDLQFNSDYLDLLLGQADWRGGYRGILPFFQRSADNPVELTAHLPMRGWTLLRAEEIKARFDGPSGVSRWQGQLVRSGGAHPHWQGGFEIDRFYWEDWSGDDDWFPEGAWPLGWLGSSTGSVELRAGRFSDIWFSGHQLDLHADWGERRLALSGQLELGTGVADLNWSLDATSAEPRFALRIAGNQLSSSAFMPTDDGPWLADGQVQLKVDLRGRGASPALMAASTDGRVFMRALDARVNPSALSLMGQDTLHQLIDVLLNILNPLADQEVMLHCAMLNLDFVDGVAESEEMLNLVTDNISGRGRGRIDLGDETLDLVLSTRPRTGLRLQLNPLARLVRLSGSLANPETSLDVTGFLEITAAVASGGWTLLGRWLADLSQPDEALCAPDARQTPEPAE